MEDKEKKEGSGKREAPGRGYPRLGQSEQQEPP